MYQVLYRTRRPERFADMVGRDAVVAALRHQVSTGRIAHAYLFCGTRGTGKTTAARVLSRAVNCENPQEGDACGECAPCRALRGEQSMDIMELDAASNNGVDEVRDLREKIKYPPAVGRYRVIIVDEAHMLSGGAFNALLKTLEEPPPHALFILCTTEPQRLPATILSRCQRFDFARVSAQTIAALLATVTDDLAVAAEPGALALLARMAGGSFRDALSLLDVALGFAALSPGGSGTLTQEIAREALGTPGDEFFQAMAARLIAYDGGGALALADQWLRGGRDAAVLLRELAGYVHSIIVATQTPDAAAVLEMSAEEAEALAETGERAPLSAWLRWLELFARAESELRYATQPRILLDLCLLSAAHPEAAPEASAAQALTERVARLEALCEKLAAGGGADGMASTEPQREAPPASIDTSPAKKPRANPKPPASAQANGSADEPFRALLAKLKSAPATIGRSFLLAKGVPVSFEGGLLTVRFTAKDQSSYDVLSREKDHADLETALRSAVGDGARLALTMDGGPEPAPRGHSLLDQAAEVFGRGIIVVEEDE